jgi:hypothetical protein
MKWHAAKLAGLAERNKARKLKRLLKRFDAVISVASVPKRSPLKRQPVHWEVPCD